jgi:hypothetical protein
MIGRLRRRNVGLDNAPIGFVLASGKPPPDARSVAEVFDHLTKGHPHMRDVEVFDAEPPVATLVVAGVVPLMIQWIEGPFPTERMPEEVKRQTAALADHRHHLAVLSPGADSERDLGEKLLASLAVVVMIQAVALCTRAHAVCWASSGGIYTAQEWTRGCTRYLRDGLIPADMVTRLITNSDRGKVFVSTIGMKLFGMSEIEIWDSERSPDATRQIAIDAILDSLLAGEISHRGSVWSWRTGPAEFRVANRRSVLEHGERVTVLNETKG